MRLWGRHPERAPLPVDVRDALGLAGGARVLAWSPLVGGGWAVATVTGLRTLLPRGVLVDRPWTDVHHAAWDADSHLIVVWWVGSRQPSPLELEAEGSFLPEVVHERVRASVVLARDLVVPGGRMVWVALRQGADGTLSTQAVAPPGVRLSDPEVGALVARARAELRDEAGASG